MVYHIHDPMDLFRQISGLKERVHVSALILVLSTQMLLV